jgi:NAD(P)H dehydrogenase (quinone)
VTKVAIIYHSETGHTGVVAHQVAAGVEDGGSQAIMLKIDNAAQDFTDMIDQASEADAIIFGSPTFMGDISSPLKAFFEATAYAWMSMDWKDKMAGGFTNSMQFAGDKAHALNSILVLAMQHGMIWVGAGQPPGHHTNGNAAPGQVNRLGYSVGVATQSDNLSPDLTPPTGDREFARLYGERIAHLVRRIRVQHHDREASFHFPRQISQQLA